MRTLCFECGEDAKSEKICDNCMNSGIPLFIPRINMLSGDLRVSNLAGKAPLEDLIRIAKEKKIRDSRIYTLECMGPLCTIQELCEIRDITQKDDIQKKEFDSLLIKLANKYYLPGDKVFRIPQP